jgi:RNA polymerase sigma factor (sigma-70 family)
VQPLSAAVPVEPTSKTRADQAIFSIHDRYAHWFRRRLVGAYGRDDADELEQETWLRLIPHLALHEIRHPRAFLLKVAANLASDRASRRRRQLRLVAEVGGLAGCGDTSAPQEDAVLAKELILGLPEALRDVLVLSRFAGLTNVQIGERLGISPKTVEWRMTRALAHCAAQLRR